MARTILPRKANFEIPIATDDEAQQQLISDPAIPQFGNSYGTTYVSSNGPAAFGPSSTGGFGGGGYVDSNATYGQPNGQPFYQAPVLTNSGSNAGQDAEVLVKNDNSDWINRRWRPAMGWMYMAVCIFDFILFPIMFTIVQFWETQAANDAFRQWQPVTLMGAGLFHMAMGAVLGIAAYGRTKEKLEGATKN